MEGEVFLIIKVYPLYRLKRKRSLFSLSVRTFDSLHSSDSYVVIKDGCSKNTETMIEDHCMGSPFIIFLVNMIRFLKVFGTTFWLNLLFCQRVQLGGLCTGKALGTHIAWHRNLSWFYYCSLGGIYTNTALGANLVGCLALYTVEAYYV